MGSRGGRVPGVSANVMINLGRAAEVFMGQLDESAGMWSTELAEMVVVLALRCVDRQPSARPT